MAKGRKRSNGEGTIYQVDGRWVSQISYWKNGKLKRPRRISDKQADAVVKLAELRDQAQTLDMDQQGHSVKSYLEFWLGDPETTELEPNTYISYKSILNNHLIPQLGSVKLSDLKATKIRTAITNLQKNGTGSRAVELTYVVLNAALKQATADDVIPKNPCVSIKKPSHKSDECVPYSSSERKLIFDEAKGDYFEPLYRIMLATGIRSSEAFGLYWKNIDMKNRTIRICQQYSRGEIKDLKTRHSVRTLDITDGIAEMLEIQKKQMKEYGYHKKPQVFCGKRGAFLDVINFGKKNWIPLQQRVGVRPRGLHHLRHTFATELLNNDVQVHVVSRLLGHSSPVVTYEIYAHLIPEKQSEAASVIQRIFG